VTISSTLIRGARLVPIGVPAPTDRPVDIRIRAGVVTEVEPVLEPVGDETVIDAAGRWAVPGLWDQHAHLTWWAQSRSKLDVSGSAGPEDVLRIVGDHVASQPGPWRSGAIVGYGFRTATWRQAPTVAMLDTVSGAHPVILASGDGHTGWVNSKALALLGVAHRSGPLLESEWFDLQPQVAALSAASEDSDLLLRAAVDDAASKGIVGVVDFEMAAGYLDWPGRFARGINQIRIRPVTYPDRLDDVLAAGLRTGSDLCSAPLPEDDRGHQPGLLTMGPLKIFSDGSLNTRTAYCCDPYTDSDGTDQSRGHRAYDQQTLEELLTRGSSGGLRIALHAIGDAAVDQALRAFEATGAQGGIEHVQLIRLADIARMRALGVRASVQPAHLLDDREVAQQCWADRTDRCFALGSMLRGGVNLALGSDAPVSPLDPRIAMAAAVDRGADNTTEPWNAAEALTPAEALAASTDDQTTVAVGSRGDVVLLDDDPLAAAGTPAQMGAHLRSLGVAATILAGRPTHLAL
jgi:predicted amidohydrolase YtcJ